MKWNEFFSFSVLFYLLLLLSVVSYSFVSHFYLWLCVHFTFVRHSYSFVSYFYVCLFVQSFNWLSGIDWLFAAGGMQERFVSSTDRTHRIDQTHPTDRTHRLFPLWYRIPVVFQPVLDCEIPNHKKKFCSSLKSLKNFCGTLSLNVISGL